MSPVDHRSDSGRDYAGTDAHFRQRARALGDATRYAIYRELDRAGEAVAVSQLTATFDLNHNTVRQHLAKLRDAGLIEEVREEPRGPGRPRILYRLTGEAASVWNLEGAYERLSMVLLELVTTDATVEEVGYAAGGRAPIDPRAETPLEEMTSAMAAQGFAPHVERLPDPDHGGSDPETYEVALGHCPFAAAAENSPEVVCALHRSMLDGLADRIDGIEVDELVAGDPRAGCCRVRVGATTKGHRVPTAPR